MISASPCPVFLTLSPKSKDYSSSTIVINWGTSNESSACTTPPEWIGLYDKNPFLYENLSPIFHHYLNELKTGRVETDIKFRKLNLPEPWNNKSSGNLKNLCSDDINSSTTCLNFYVMSYSKNNEILSFDCLKIQPTWMSEMSEIKEVPLKYLFIPGTHCSGCYQNKINQRSLVLKKLGFLQNFDVWTQLVFGIRYLEFSIGYFPLKTPGETEENEESLIEHFWIMNDDLKVTLLRPILEDIKKFVEMSGEIVLLDFKKLESGKLCNLKKVFKKYHILFYRFFFTFTTSQNSCSIIKLLF